MMKSVLNCYIFIKQWFHVNKSITKNSSRIIISSQMNKFLNATKNEAVKAMIQVENTPAFSNCVENKCQVSCLSF